MSNEPFRFARPGDQGVLGPAEVDAFLAEPVLCRLGCLDNDGWPYVVPTWFEWDGRGFWIIPRQRAAWAGYMQANPRVSLCIDDTATGRRVVGRGLAKLIETPNVGGQWVEIGRRMAERYRGEAGRRYLDATLNQPRWLFYVELERLVTWNGSGWHAKYVVDQ